MSALRISQLAERAGVPATTLRFYEIAGLLPAGRSANGYRLYGEDTVERLAFIGAAKHLGLPLEEIAELLAVWESGTCAEVKADLRPRIAQRIANAETRAAELAAFISTLRRTLKHLESLPDRMTRCDPGCGFLVPGPEVAVSGEQESERWRTAPVACSLDRDGVRTRTAEWRALTEGARRRQQISDGVRLSWPATRVAEVAALAAAEQRCCPFFDFRLHFDGPMVHLEMRAPADAAELLHDLIGSGG
jgi:DNA-binding transcriptional MerR regulator